MSTAPKLQSVSIDDYLDGELNSSTKYEFVNGRVYAMAGGKNAHNRLASRVLVSLGNQLGSTGCEAYNSDTKVRIKNESQTYFYYPDAMVVCDSNADEDTFQDRPSLIVEVISESTRRIDEGEKLDHYLTIPTLQAYVLLEQTTPAARVFSRDSGGSFKETIHQGGESKIPFETLNISLRLSDLYR